MRIKPKMLFRIIWELPQNLIGLGFLIVSLLHNQISYIECEDDGTYFIEWTDKMKMSSISLGIFSFQGQIKLEMNPMNLFHERGHHLQSFILGPLYLIIITIPTIIRNIYLLNRYKKGKFDNCKEFIDVYYRGLIERWADKLGNVERKEKPC